MQGLEAKVGTSVGDLVQDMKRWCSEVANYDKFERAFSAPEGTEPQEHLENYKTDHLSALSAKTLWTSCSMSLVGTTTRL